MRPMLRIVLAVSLLCCISTGVLAQSSNNVDLLDRWAYGPTNTVFISGNYAYTGAGGYLAIYDINSDPNNVAEVGKLAMPKPLLAITVSGSYAYAVDGDSLYIIDVSTPASPVRAGAIVTPGRAQAVAYNSNTVYIADGLQGLYVVDVTTPAAPAEAGYFDPGGTARSVAYYGTELYMTYTDESIASNNAIRVFDVSTPSAIVQVGIYSNVVRPHDIALTNIGGTDYALLADSTSLRVVDVSTPSAMADHDTVQIHSCVYAVVFGASGGTDYAFIADRDRGNDLVRVDLSDVGTPANFDFNDIDEDVDTGGDAVDVALGNANAYVYAATGLGGFRSYSSTDFTTAGDDIVAVTGGGQLRNVTASATRIYVADGDDGIRELDATASPIVELTRNSADFAGCVAYGVFLYDDTLYVASGAEGLQMYATADITTRVGQFDTEGNATGVYVSGDYAYVADGTKGLRIIDIHDSANPAEVGSYTTFDSISDIARNVWVRGSYAYVAVGYKGIWIVNVSNPASPVYTGMVSMAGEVYNVTVDVPGNYAYVADGVDGLRVVSVSTPSAPSIVATYNTGGIARDVMVSGNYAYVADGNQGMRVYNISTPTAAQEVGYYDTGDDAYAIYLLDYENIYLVDNEDGLYKFDNILAHPTHFVSPTYTITAVTGRSIPVVIQSLSLLGKDNLTAGDEVAIFDGASRVVGRAVYEGSMPITLTVWMRYYDPVTVTTLPGAYSGNNMIFRVWNKSTGTVLDLGGFPSYLFGNGTFSDTQLLTVVNPLTAYQLNGFTPVMPTGAYMLVTIQNDISINETAIESGDEIAIYDGGICVGAVEYQGAAVTIPVWLDTYIPPANEHLVGASQDHYMTFKIYDNSTGTTYTGRPTYATGTTGQFGQTTATVVKLESYTFTTQNITVESGRLNVISFNIDPLLDEDQEINTMLDDIIATNIFAQDDEGNYYLSGSSYNSIGVVDLSNGYQVYHNAGSDQTVSNDGFVLVPSSIILSMSSNRFYMIGYPYQLAHNATEVFAGYSANIVVLQDDNEGLYWIPDYSINTIDLNGGMKPGRGYKIFVDATTNMTFPSLADGITKTVPAESKQPVEPVHFQFHKSGVSYAVIIAASAASLETGDEIGLFSGDLCVGAAVFNGQYPFVIPSWGRVDQEDLQVPGFSQGDEITVKIWTGAQGREIPVPVETKDGPAVFGRGALTVISLDEPAVEDLLPREFDLEQNFPNPFNPETSIRYSVPQASKVTIEIFNEMGQKIRTLVQEEKPAGRYLAIWDGRNDAGGALSTGLYIVSMRAGSFHKQQKMLLIK